MKNTDDGTGNSEKDWEIFDVLCRNMEKVCGVENRESINNPPINPTFLSSPLTPKSMKFITRIQSVPMSTIWFVYIDFNSSNTREWMAVR